jgi:hypothetical protein
MSPILSCAFLVAVSIVLAPASAHAQGVGRACVLTGLSYRCDPGLECTSALVCVCVSDSGCDDGVWCNGEETCRDGGCEAGEDVCSATQDCDEASMSCHFRCPVAPDADGDGADSIACGGTDCDDSDPNRFPGNIEVCDADDHDEDCDPRTFGSKDTDGDGYIDRACVNYN